MSVDTGAFTIHKTTNGAAVLGSSRGSDGATGGNAYIIGTAGNGGAGADGGTVVVAVDGVITTTGNNSSGVVARSLAGDGGTGGVAYLDLFGSSGNGGRGGFGGNASATIQSGSIETSGTGSVGVLAFSQGGNAGQGGAGGIIVAPGTPGNAGQAGAAIVSTATGTTIITHGDSAYGIGARSIGGGGGTGASDSGVFYSLGTNGSTGGAGGSVTVNSFGTIVTYGEGAHGIYAQSAGGGGGDAGLSSSLIVAMGATGGVGGAGGQVDVINAGAISTHGFRANAIEAQSIGGGGGNGGVATGALTTGGSGGGATAGGAVTVTNTGTLSTDYGQSAGLFAHSVGGGGGNGAVVNGTFYRAGGSGGTGSNGSTVTVTNSGDIFTGQLVPGLVPDFSLLVGTPENFSLFVTPSQSIDDSPGILAQSIGGGGGVGAGSMSESATGLSINYGGTGGAAGDGGIVRVNRDHSDWMLATSYTIHTFAQRSAAIVAQSLGGGGGLGGFSVTLTSNGLFGIGWGTSGTGGAGGDAGDVFVETKGWLITDGAMSPGILAESTGGGGGDGGYFITGAAGGAGLAIAVGATGGSGGNGAAVNVSNRSHITTAGLFSHGIEASSLGGGGGNGGFAIAASAGLGVVNFGLGGTGGGGGWAGTTTVNSIGDISTAGSGAAGITARSVGGGGGSGGFSVTAAVGVAAITMGIGGVGGNGNSAGNVEVDSIGRISTSGGSSPGILARSLGGGGGDGGWTVNAAASGGLSVATGIGGDGGIGSTAGTVNIDSLGVPGLTEAGFAGAWTIITRGAFSPGISGTSTGGGGGDGGFAVTASVSVPVWGYAASATWSVGGNGGAGNAGNTVDITSTGSILTLGDFSPAIRAKSLGGGGGDGGFSVGAGISLGQAGLTFSAGGDGGTGSTSAKVTVNAYGLTNPGGTASALDSPSIGTVTLQTAGFRSIGISAQSVGGGGGSGGFSVAAGFAAAGLPVAVTLGGIGGDGNAAGDVDVTSYHNIATAGAESPGILAYSLGGGGGDGGFSVAFAAGSQVTSLGFSMGGVGGSGSTAGKVDLRSYGTVTTIGTTSPALHAQSQGGGGGNGGFSVAGAFTLGSFAGAVSIGGSGGTGNTAGEVTLEAYAMASAGAPILTVPIGLVTLQTSGDDSDGLLAQSIGGGGGNGGFAAAGVLSTTGVALTGVFGGSGGTGGAASSVLVTSVHNIETAGDYSNGIFAESLGGGGGKGRMALSLAAGSKFAGNLQLGGLVGLTGLGGVGGSAGEVTVNHTGTIKTLGVESAGIRAESNGGGGGQGGMAISGAFAMTGGALGAALGGTGGAGGVGGAVAINSNIDTILGNVYTIETHGNGAEGIFAQSLGGGGGKGGLAVSASVDLKSKVVGSLAIGGSGGSGNTGGAVRVTSVDNILTLGVGADGILAQSLGGGGGVGGLSVSGGLHVPDGNDLALTVSMGGAGGAGDNADLVNVTSTGWIHTSANYANGIWAQSLGGGGGKGGLSVAATIGACGTCTSVIPQISLSVGGRGGPGGSASDVTVWHDGGIEVTGDYAAGLRVQSIGGGGGDGGLSVTGSLSGADPKQIAVAVGGAGGPGSQGGIVKVTNFGSITTGSLGMETVLVGTEAGPEFQQMAAREGFEGAGIIAQSIGGGGGNGGLAISGALGLTGEHTRLNIASSWGGFGGSGGYGGDVTVENDGFIHTFGHGAHGILAQSLGGGGGAGGAKIAGVAGFGDVEPTTTTVQFALALGGRGGDGNYAGKVMVTQAGGIQTSGSGAHGILAQSVGGGGGAGGTANTISLLIGNLCTLTVPTLQIANCKAAKSTGGVNAQLALGGFGGTGNHAGQVEVTNDDFIRTSGPFSAGIIAQSIGAGGGTGGNGLVGTEGLIPEPTLDSRLGYALLAAGTLAGTSPQTLPVPLVSLNGSVGGFGGASGNGATVTITNRGTIDTVGISSYGILAQSVGGGGGDGGKSNSGATGIASVGGFGGASGNGDIVTVTNELAADITTQGNDAHAIFAQSIGGGGGNGGGSGGVLSLGGFGLAGGTGGTVSVQNHADLTTFGTNARGIVAQSLGGGGGSGGGPGTSAITVGGFAATGSDGGEVTVTNAGKIHTSSASAHGVVAQSLGGGGGDGGSTGLAVIAVGGWGGGGGIGGHVTAFNHGLIVTDGADAIGLFGQSIGGGGGLAGSTFLSAIGVGGGGGVSGNGGAVELTNTSQITTFGAGADAIRAQSVGGGGGSVTGDADAAAATGGSLLVSIGAGGIVGGNGDLAKVTNHGLLQTFGEDASGIKAQSIGGGGGDGGRAGAGLFAIGGRGGAAGNGASVDVVNEATGVIVTDGARSNGIFAQSIGGGGGSAGGTSSLGLLINVDIGARGAGGGSGGFVQVGNYGFIQANGVQSQGIFAQSVGGGGGVGGDNSVYTVQPSSISLSIGGRGGLGGDGGQVGVANQLNGTILMLGADSTGIFAQSVGGGGGAGGLGSQGALDMVPGIVSIDIGGRGGDGGSVSGGSGGNVTVINEGLIDLAGNNSLGILAQSIGGGGGIGAARFVDIGLSLGGKDGVAGNGGRVTVTNHGTIVLRGENSIGIFAQSIGGGGGLMLPGSGASAVRANDGGVGNSDNVTIHNTAKNIVVIGDGSIGVFSQSVGGGGGLAGNDTTPLLFAGTAGGSGVTRPSAVNQTGNIFALGANSFGMVVQNDAKDARSDVTINILNDASGERSIIAGGSGLGAGVAILGGARNQLNNGGWISTVLGIKGTAIRATVGDDRVENTGTIVGSVDLGAGTNAFVNALKASFMAGDQVMLGAGNTLTNRGTLWAGDPGRVSTTALTGNFVQSTDGVFTVDLDLRFGAADRLNVSGTASVDGTIKVNLINPLANVIAAKPGTYDAVIVSAAGGQNGTGGGVQAVPSLTLQASTTAVLTYSIERPASTDLVLRHTIDFAPAGLTGNSQAVGQAINAIQTAQTSPAFAPLAGALFYQPDLPSLEKTYASLSGSAVAGLAGLSFSSTDAFMLAIGRQTQMWLGNRAIDVNGDVARGASSGRWRTWFGRDGASTLTVPGSEAVGSVDSRQQGYFTSGGVDYQPTRHLLLGVAAGGGTRTFHASLGDARGSARTNYAAGYGAWTMKGAYVTGAVAVSHQTNETARLAEIPMTTLPAESGGTQMGGAEALFGRSRGWGIGTAVEGGYMHAFGWLAVGPFAGIQATTLRTAAHIETNEAGASLLGLSFGSRDVWSAPAFAGLQVRTESALSRIISVSFFGRATWIRELTPQRTLEAAFISAPGTSFVVRGAEPSSDARRALLGVQVAVGLVGVFVEGNADFLRGGAIYSGAAGLRVRW
jgi:uncharacterized protein YhjY with autotransporter beta-barrel domain